MNMSAMLEILGLNRVVKKGTIKELETEPERIETGDIVDDVTVIQSTE